MDFLVLAPPVCTPAEPPSGAFVLAAGLAARGFDTGLLDLSLELYHRVLAPAAERRPAVAAALEYLRRGEARGYRPDQHRSHTGVVRGALARFDRDHPGWKLTLMDLAPPVRVHQPAALAALLAREPSPFADLWSAALDPVLERHRPRRVLVSLAYLSQLPAAIDLVAHLTALGIEPVVGGSLPGSLAATGHGLAALGAVFPRIALGDGLALIGAPASARLLERLTWPRLLSERPYLSARPIVPLALSSGCHWRRCLFCPDRGLELVRVPAATIDAFLASLPAAVAAARPVLHLLDSALPPPELRALLPIAAAHRVDFYGFARPTAALLADGLIDAAAEHGCLMLQLGAESGSAPLLARYDKGFAPDEAARVIDAAAAAGIRTYLYLLFGLPGERDEDRERTRALVADHAPAIDFLNLSLFNLPRYCELAERADEFGIVAADFPGDEAHIRLYRPFTCAGESPRDAARRFLRARFHPDPAIRPIELRTPRWLRAAHLALMRVDGRREP